jgi:hypothetical protein
VWDVGYSELVTWSFQENAGENMYAWKARICRAKNVEILFDDDPLVLCQLNPTVVSMMVSTTKPTIWLGWRMAMMTGTRADEVERLTSLQSLP